MLEFPAETQRSTAKVGMLLFITIKGWLYGQCLELVVALMLASWNALRA